MDKLNAATWLNQKINPEVFKLIEIGATDELCGFSKHDLSPFLPILARSSLIQPPEGMGRGALHPKDTLMAIAENDRMNNIVNILSVDFLALEMDVKKEMQLRQKIGSREQDSVLLQNCLIGIAVDFEKNEAQRKIRLILSDILFILSQIHEPRAEYYMKSSELFDNWIFLDDICDHLSIALVELPSVLSLVDVCEALLHVKYGPWIICRLVANLPDSFTEICYNLISNGDKCEEESEGGIVRLEALKLLCRLNPRMSLLIRSRCVEMCRMPALTMFLSLEDNDVEKNLIPFCTGILLGNDQQVRNWFSAYIRNGQKRKCDSTNSLSRMREALFLYLEKFLSPNCKTIDSSNVVRASTLLRLICALKGIASFKFNDKEINDLVNLITLKAPSTPPGENASGVNSSFGEILLLMAIHFHSNQLSAISELVCTTLGMKIAIRVNSMTRIKQIFIQDIFTEQVVTAHAVRVPVTPNLNGDQLGFLPVHCIYQLIKSRAFTKHKVPIKDWIYRQINSSTLPMHPVLPALLEVYTQSILVPGTSTVGSTKVLLELTNEPLTDNEVLAVFKTFHNLNLAPQLLILYYLLLYEDNRLSNYRNLIQLGKKVKTYSGKLFSQIPIKFLLQEAQKHQNNCGGLFPSLLKLLTTHFPQLCIVHEWLEDSTSLSVDGSSLSKGRKCQEVEIPKDSFEKAFSAIGDQPVDAIKLLETCKTLSPHNLWSHSKEIVSQIRKILPPSVPRKVQDLYKDIWYLLNNVYPRHLWEITSNALLPDGSLNLTADELTMDPLQILRCDPQVYRCPPVLNILLHILAATLASSKYFLTKHLMENLSPAPPGTIVQTDVEKEEMKNALVALQDSAAVQILLEACLPNQEDKDGLASDLTIKEVQSLICSFLHQMFISDPMLAKLVHFQGYPLELLPITVRGIPSMHICLDYIPELLGQPQIEKQVFAIQLISHLSVQYALPKSLNSARIAVGFMNQMVSGLVSEERAEVFIPALSALERLCIAFPPLVEEATGLLLHLGKVCSAQNAVERNRMCRVVRNSYLLRKVNETQAAIMKHVMLDRRIL
ncbi:unnamed protein product [Orchesella dallaii]|uniref:Integrator complex subunit 2 n=1 Tax=Orchesella dallaii TaxID=48710 RepID=A0ABP1QMP8_9HEXA